MVNSLADESALLAELRELADQGRYHEVLDRLRGLPVAALEGRTAFALLAAEAHGRQGDHLEARRWAELALVVARARGERPTELRALNYRGAIALRHGDVDEAEQRFGEALDRARAAAEQAVRLATVARDDSLLGLAFTGRAEIHLLMGDEDLARVELERAAEVYGRVNFAAGLPEVWRLQAAVARTRGDLPETLRLLRQAAELATTQGSAESLAAIERDFGAALQLAGDRAGAEAARRRALALYERLGATRAARDIAALIAQSS